MILLFLSILHGKKRPKRLHYTRFEFGSSLREKSLGVRVHFFRDCRGKSLVTDKRAGRRSPTPADHVTAGRLGKRPVRVLFIIVTRLHMGPKREINFYGQTHCNTAAVSKRYFIGVRMRCPKRPVNGVINFRTR